MGTEITTSGTLYRGFTTIEMPVVMAVIAVPSMLAIPSRPDTVVRNVVVKLRPMRRARDHGGTCPPAALSAMHPCHSPGRLAPRVADST